jgi:hypothetical protein
VSLRLRYVGFDRVEFLLLDADGRVERPVVVMVGSGRQWRETVGFPNLVSEAGETTGDPALDRLICDRAAEELVRLDAALRLVGVRGAA